MKYRKKYLNAIEELIEHYRKIKRGDKVSSPYDCPLCEIINKCKHASCDTCPWVLFEGETCLTKRYESDGKTKRIRRLNKWKRLIKTGGR